MIKAITFDLWNTIIANKFYTIQRLNLLIQFLKRREIDYSLEEIKNAYNINFFFQDVTLINLKYKHIYTEDRISKLLKALNINISQKEKDLLKDKFETIALTEPPPLKIGVKNTLEELSTNYQIGLISNTGITPGPVLRKILEKHGVLQFFDVTVFSDETGLFKPHPKMFKIPLDKLNCAPQEAIHIGDILETDVRGAKEFNMKAVWVNDRNSPNSSNIQPDFEIKEIPEIIQIIQTL